MAKYTGLEKPGRWAEFAYESSLRHSPVKSNGGEATAAAGDPTNNPSSSAKSKRRLSTGSTLASLARSNSKQSKMSRRRSSGRSDSYDVVCSHGGFESYPGVPVLQRLNFPNRQWNQSKNRTIWLLDSTSALLCIWAISVTVHNHNLPGPQSRRAPSIIYLFVGANDKSIHRLGYQLCPAHYPPCPCLMSL